MKKIVVIGATGEQGQGFVRHFCQLVKPQDKFQLKCVSRDKKSHKCSALFNCDDSGSMIDCVTGNLEDLLKPDRHEHFSQLARGCTGMFVVLQSGEQEAEIGKKLIDLASNAGIQHFIYSSVANADLATEVPEYEPKKQIQDYLLAHQSNFESWTIIRPTFFYQNFLKGNILNRIKQESILEFPLPPGTKLQMVDVQDVGELAVNAFLAPQEFHTKIIDLVGSERTMAEYASLLGCQYYETSPDDLEDDMRKKFMWFQTEGFHGRLDYCLELLPSMSSFENWALGSHLITPTVAQKKLESEISAQSETLPAGSAV